MTKKTTTTKLALLIEKLALVTRIWFDDQNAGFDDQVNVEKQIQKQGSNYRSKDVTQMQQQQPESPTVALTWNPVHGA